MTSLRSSTAAASIVRSDVPSQHFIECPIELLVGAVNGVRLPQQAGSLHSFDNPSRARRFQYERHFDDAAEAVDSANLIDETFRRIRIAFVLRELDHIHPSPRVASDFHTPWDAAPNCGNFSTICAFSGHDRCHILILPQWSSAKVFASVECGGIARRRDGVTAEAAVPTIQTGEYRRGLGLDLIRISLGPDTMSLVDQGVTARRDGISSTLCGGRTLTQLRVLPPCRARTGVRDNSPRATRISGGLDYSPEGFSPTSSQALPTRKGRSQFGSADCTPAVTLLGRPRGGSRPRRRVRAALSKQRRWERFIFTRRHSFISTATPSPWRSMGGSAPHPPPPQPERCRHIHTRQTWTGNYRRVSALWFF